MRQAMPTVAAWIDQMREAFGAEEINAAIRAGIEGQPTFYARENGAEVGTRYEPPAGRTVAGNEIARPILSAASHSTQRNHRR